MATKTISIETDAYELLVREKRDPRESFSRVIRRLFAERPNATAESSSPIARLGSRIAERFRHGGLVTDLPELRGQALKAVDERPSSG